jgi:hypothetical protein
VVDGAGSVCRGSGKPFFEAFPGITEQMIEIDLLRVANGRLLLTEKGWFLSNQVFYRFL